MGLIKTLGRYAWRKFALDGVSSSGFHEPDHPDIFAFIDKVDEYLAALSAAGSLKGGWSASSGIFPGAGITAKGDTWLVTTAGTTGGQFFAEGDRLVALVVNASTSVFGANWGVIPANARTIVSGVDEGAGTANAIQITTDTPVADGMAVFFSLFEATTSSPVTVAINGGSALTLKTNRGSNASALSANMEVWGRVRSSDNTLRLLNDQDVSALVAQAEDARDEAVAAASAASAVATAGYSFDRNSDFLAANIPAPVSVIHLSGYHAPGDGGEHRKVRIAAPSPIKPWHTQSADGAWWAVATGQTITPQVFGARGDENGTGVGTEDTAAFDVAVAFTDEVHLPSGGYRVARTYSAYTFTGPGVMYLNGTEKIVRNLPVPGSVVQSLSAVSYADNVDLTTAIPFDNTAPRNNEGTEVIYASLAKNYKNSSVLVEFDAQVTADTAGVNATAAFFVSEPDDIYTDETSARRATFVTVPSANYGVPLRLVHHTKNADAAEYQYSIRVGPSANTLRLNGISTQLRFAGASMASMRLTELGGELLTWGGDQGNGVLEGAPILASNGVSPAAPGVVHYTVSTPSGGTVTEADLTSHRYRHHTQVAEHNGKVWVMHSSGGTNEDAGGQMTVVEVSDASTVSFSAPMLLMPAQSAFGATNAAFELGTRVSYPSCFAKYGGKLYAIAAVDEVVAGPQTQGGGVLLAAAECKDDGTLGALFRITSDSYTPASGVSAISYDATLGPPLFSHARIYGVWGDSSGKSVDWETFVQFGGKSYSEPTCIDVDGDESFLLQVWRRLTAPNYEAAVRASYDGGKTWTAMRTTDIPNSPSSLAGARLPDGRIALVGNLKLGRDPLYLAIFDAVYRVRDQVYEVRSGLPVAPTYPGTYKDAPSAAYPGMYVGETYLWVSYSISKETIAVSRIPLAGL